jgi:hypothetical protein
VGEREILRRHDREVVYIRKQVGRCRVLRTIIDSDEELRAGAHWAHLLKCWAFGVSDCMLFTVEKNSTRIKQCVHLTMVCFCDRFICLPRGKVHPSSVVAARNEILW